MVYSVPVGATNPGSALRVVVTKPIIGDRWINVLVRAGCRVEVLHLPDGEQRTWQAYRKLG